MNKMNKRNYSSKEKCLRDFIKACSNVRTDLVKKGKIELIC